MNKSEFVKLFAPKVKEIGFDKKRNMLFYQKLQNGFIAIALDVKEEIYGLKVSPYVSFRIDKIEEIVRMFPENSVGKKIPTFHINLGYLVDGKQKFWIVESKKHQKYGNIYLAVHDKIGLPKLDVKPLANEVIDEIGFLVTEHAKPFLDKFTKNLQNVFLLLSSQEDVMLKSIFLENVLAKQLITTAFLLKDKKLFENLVLEQRILILEKYDFDIKYFDELTNYLRNKF